MRRPWLFLLAAMACSAPSGVRGGPDGGVSGTLAPHAAGALVSGGASMVSAHYRLITTTGQGPGDQSTLTSSHYVLVGGVAGATQGR